MVCIWLHRRCVGRDYHIWRCFFYLWIDWPHSVQVLTERGLGDPMSLQQGVSVWRCIALRAMTLTLSLWLIFFAWWKLGFNIAEITDHMKIEYKPKKNNSGDANPVLRQSAETCDTPAEQMTASKIERQLPEICDMQQPWDRYIANGHPVIKAIRIIGYVLAMCLFSLLLVGFWGKPSNPARGDMAWKIYDILTVVDVVVMLFLVFFVFDTTFRCLLFVTRLVKHRTQWPRTTKECFNAKYGFNERPTDHGVLDDWIDMYFIAKRTRCINEIIYYPFAIIALMIVSRSAVFGDFALNPPDHNHTGDHASDYRFRLRHRVEPRRGGSARHRQTACLGKNHSGEKERRRPGRTMGDPARWNQQYARRRFQAFPPAARLRGNHSCR